MKLQYDVYHRCWCYIFNQTLMAQEQEFIQFNLLLVAKIGFDFARSFGGKGLYIASAATDMDHFWRESNWRTDGAHYGGKKAKS